MMGLDQRRVKVFFGLPTLGSIQIELRSFVRKTSHPYGTRITTPTEYITLAENYKGGHQGFALIPLVSTVEAHFCCWQASNRPEKV